MLGLPRHALEHVLLPSGSPSSHARRYYSASSIRNG